MSHQHKTDFEKKRLNNFWEFRRTKNKKKRTKNKTLNNTKWKRGRSRMRVVHRNYRTPVGEVRENPLKTRTRNSI